MHEKHQTYSASSSPQAWPLCLDVSPPSKSVRFQAQVRFRFGGCPEYPKRSLQPKISHNATFLAGLEMCGFFAVDILIVHTVA